MVAATKVVFRDRRKPLNRRPSFRLSVTGLGIGGEFKLFVEDDEGGFLALPDLSAGLGPLLVRAPVAGAGIGPERHDVDAVIGLLRGDVDGSHDVAGRAMPWQAEVSCAALDRADDLVGDVLVDIEAFLGHGGSPLAASRLRGGSVQEKAAE
jgi:hypothetical protein